MKIIQAGPSDLSTVVRLRREATAWLATLGQDQWSSDWPDTETMIAGFARDLTAGSTWFALDESGAVAGAITVNDQTNPGLWSQQETATALFVHRLTVARNAAGSGVGGRLLDFAGDAACRAGREWLRLDAWTSNRQLHRYYLSQGFRHVRTVANHYSPSAACFERPAAYRYNDEGSPASRRDQVMDQA